MTLLLRHVRLAAEKNGAPADILLSGGKISAIGDLPPRADFIFEGEGAFASPGFIDVHAAADHSFALLQHPAQTDTLAQGITSALIGQKGFSLAPLPERPADIFPFPYAQRVNTNWRFLGEMGEHLNRRGLGLNFLSLVGLENLKSAVRRARVKFKTAAARQVMLAELAHAFRDGAWGISLRADSTADDSLRTADYKALFSAVAEAAGIISLSYAADPASWSFILQTATQYPGRVVLTGFAPPDSKSSAEGLGILEKAFHDFGLRFEVSPAPLRIQNAADFLPAWARQIAEHDRSVLADEWYLRRIRREMPAFAPGAVHVVAADKGEPLVGYSLAEICKLSGDQDPRDTLFRLLRETNFRISFEIRRPQAFIRAALALPGSLLGTGGSAQIADSIYPVAIAAANESSFREYLRGACARPVELAAALQKLTVAPADFLGLPHRGRLQPGYAGDVTVFDPTGNLRLAVVNGRPAWLADGGPVAAAGRFLFKSKK